jgi:hypothetical protein
VTRRLYDVLLNSGIRGFRAEVAHGS